MSSLLQFLTTLVQWQYFGFLVVLWIVLDLIWIERWKSLIARLGNLITKPWIFRQDIEPNVPPLYPRLFLEQLAQITRRESIDSYSKTTSEDTLQRWANAQKDRVFEIYRPLRSLGYVLALALFIFFLLADAITITSTMVLLGLMSEPPPFLQRLDLSIIGGSFISAIVGVWVLVEMSGKEGELINTDILSDVQKRVFKMFSLTTTLFSVIVIIALGIQRLILLGSLQSTPTMDLMLSFILYGLLGINITLAATILFQSAASGLIVVIFLLIGSLPVSAFLLDVLWRIAYVVVDVLVWVILTPIVSVPYVIGKVFGLMK